MLSLPTLLFYSSALLAGSALADTCSQVEALSSIDVARSPELAYLDEQEEYWSTSCSALKPTCIIFPTNADEVAAVIKILKDETEDFAVKSGGHNPNNYFASVEDGPLISTQKLDQVILDPDTGIVRVGPGNRLDGLAKALDGTGWTFVGGRIGNTGVGGLILGGGLSYMSAQYGWSASSVLEYEIVLANGTVTTASGTKNPDLFKALKGGGNNFGVVTSYLLQAYRQGDVYGGNLVFPQSTTTNAKILKAVRDFTEYNEDHKAAVIVTAERAVVGAIDSWILFIFYDGPTPPEGTFKNFTDANPVLNTCKTRTYADLMAGSNWVIVPASNVMIATETIPLPSSDNGDFLDEIHAHWRNISKTTLAVPGIVASIAYQPFPKQIATEALKRSEDLIDCDDKSHRMIIEMNYSFIPHSAYSEMDVIMQNTYGGVRERVLSGQQAQRLESDVYLPVFMNYGFYQQDYFARLKPENRALAKQVAEDVDPEGLFRDRTGGWRP